jgi:hypothetical protein
MLYDGREDYIRRRAPKRVPLPDLGLVVWLATLLVLAALLFGSIEYGQPTGTDESFKLVFSWG